MAESRLTAQDVLYALSVKHGRDVFVSECKDGPTWGRLGGHLRMDAWVMPRSYSKPWTTVYEINVSRSDWTSDEKWHEYLPYCNRFLFACPWGLIEPHEVPDPAGLVWVTRTGSRVIQKRKASVRREVEIPETLFRYVLMSRATIGADRGSGMGRDAEANRAYWQRWLKQWREDKVLGHEVSVAMGKQQAVMAGELHRLRTVHERYKAVRVALTALGMNPESPPDGWGLERRLQRLRAVVPSDLRFAITSLQDQLGRMAVALDQLREPETTRQEV